MDQVLTLGINYGLNKKGEMKTIGVWLLYLLFSGGAWWLLSDDHSVVRALLFGAFVGLIGAAVYARRRHPGNRNN